MREVLKLPAYRRLFVAYTLNELAWPLGTVALAALVYRRTGSALGATAYFLAAQFVPALLAPALVRRIAGIHPRMLLPALYVLEAAAFLALGLLVPHFSLSAVLALTLIDGVLALSARSISRVTTAAVTAPAGLLREANALMNASFSVCFMAGPAIGGAVVVIGGTAAALFINCALFIVVAVTIATATSLPAPAPEVHDAGGRARTLPARARQQRVVRALLGVQAAGLLFFTISTPVEIVLVQHVLHAGAGAYGLLVSAWGAGSLIGSAVYARWRALPSRALIVLGAALLGVGFIVMALAPSLAVLAAGSALAGIGNGIEAVAARTALQEAADPQSMARVMSLNESIGQGVPGVGIALGGALAALAGARAALGIAAAGSFVVSAIAWIVLAPRATSAVSAPVGPVAPPVAPVAPPVAPVAPPVAPVAPPVGPAARAASAARR